MDPTPQPTETVSGPNLTTAQPLDSNNLTEALQVLTLMRDGSTLAQAAATLGISKSTAFRRLQLIEDDTERGVVKLLSAKALDFADNWVTAAHVAAEKGDHRPAMQALQTIKAVEPIADSSRGGNQVNILIGTPDQPIRIESPQVLKPE